MAVQADFLRDDFPTRIQSIALDDLENNQLKYGLMNPLLFNHGKVKDLTVASNRQSELTVNGSGSKKRNREESSLMDLTTQPINFGGFDPSVIGSVVDPLASMDQMRIIGSIGTSSSGRISCASNSLSIAQDLLVAHLYNQSLEIDTLIRLQNERLRLGLEQAHKRHCRSLISLLDQKLAEKVKEKDAELENALRNNAELEERVRQMSMENQIWYNFAKNNEAIVANLKASLEQVLLQNDAVNNNTIQAKEGYGDSDGTAFPADDAQSCCFFEEGEEERINGAVKIVTAKGARRTPTNSCKVCREKEVGVLLLPCRHLCLCVACESKADTCPVCHVGKNASLQIFMA